MTEKPITGEEFKKRLIDLLVKTRFQGLPRKDRDKHIILKSIALRLDAEKDYTSSEINEELRSWLGRVADTDSGDHVALRRELVDEGYLSREPDGSQYKLAPSGESRIGFDDSVEAIDILAVVMEGRDFIERKKQEFMAKKSNS